MRKRCCILALLLVLIFCLSGCRERVSVSVQESYFNEFAAADGHVTDACYVVLENHTDGDISVSIYGDYRQYQKAGYVLEGRLCAVDGEGSEIITVPPGRADFRLYFVGTAGSSGTRPDRLLPPIEIAYHP